jgi:RNA polymerase sigma factor (sigma-70 family)
VTEKSSEVEDLLRQLAPQVLGALLRRHQALDLCENAVQEALLAAARDWPASDTPENPRAWLVTVANRRLIDQVRSERSRRGREQRNAFVTPPSEVSGAPGTDETPERDDTLVLLLMCCHPSLTAPSQIALTLRAVGGLTTAEIASAFLVPEATMAQRISRAKRRVQEAGATFSMPPADELEGRVRAVLHVLYLVFNEGYTTSSGGEISRTDLTQEAMRLARELCRLRPKDSEAQGLLALMLLTDARRRARTGPSGELVSLADQDRGLWDQREIEEGVALVTGALSQGPVGAYQVQAAIAAVHDEAVSADATDWPQILALYEVLDRVAPNPMATLNRALAVAMVHGPGAGLDLLSSLADDGRVSSHHRLHAMRAHLVEMAGRPAEAREAFEEAARRTSSIPEKRYLLRRAENCNAAIENGDPAVQKSRGPARVIHR